MTSTLNGIKEVFDVPELKQNMRNSTNISRKAREPTNHWSNYPKGPVCPTLEWNRDDGVQLEEVLSEAFEAAGTNFKNLLVLPLMEDLESCFEICQQAAKRKKSDAYLYGTSEDSDASTVPKMNKKVVDNIVKKKVTMVSSMYFAQGSEFKTLIAFVPKDELSNERTNVNVTRNKYFLTRGNMLLRAVVSLVVINVR